MRKDDRCTNGNVPRPVSLALDAFGERLAPLLEGELPTEHPTAVELVLNPAAKFLGIMVRPLLLAVAANVV